VLGHDAERAWLLLADAGTPIGLVGNPPEAWLVALPLYAELQRGKAAHTDEHLKHQVPDLRVATLPARYRRSRIPSRRSSSRSGSSRRPTTCRQPTPGSRDSATRTWNRGVEVSPTRWRLLSASAHSRTHSPGPGSGTHYLTRHAGTSTRCSQSCCGAPSLRPSSESVGLPEPAAPSRRTLVSHSGD
jgi:hypothetical protein